MHTKIDDSRVNETNDISLGKNIILKSVKSSAYSEDNFAGLRGSKVREPYCQKILNKKDEYLATYYNSYSTYFRNEYIRT